MVNLGVWPIDEMLRPRCKATEQDYLFLAAAIGLFVGALAARLINGEPASDSPLYLLSSVAQSMATIVALTVTLPLAYHASARFVSGAMRYVVRSHVLVSYVVLYSVSIAIAPLALAYGTPPRALGDLTIALSFACVASLIPFIRWVSHTFRPESYLDEMLAPDYRRLSALLKSEFTQGEAGPDRYSELQKVYESALSLACEAAKSGATLHGQSATMFVVAAAIEHDEPQPTHRHSLLATASSISCGEARGTKESER